MGRTMKQIKEFLKKANSFSRYKNKDPAVGVGLSVGISSNRNSDENHQLKDVIEKAMNADQESEIIKKNQQNDTAKHKHKFKAAKWTFPNGHPRCLLCGDEERIGGYCEPLQKSDKMREVAAIAVINGNHLLMGQRKDNNSWTTAAGHLEGNESPSEGAQRELFEETGIKPDQLHHLVSKEMRGNDGEVRKIHAFATFGNHKPVLGNDPDDEFSKLEWIDTSKGLPKEIANNLHSPDNLVLQAIGLQKNGTEKLEKGMNGDWQKEGYTISHTDDPDHIGNRYFRNINVRAHDKNGEIVAHSIVSYPFSSKSHKGEVMRTDVDEDHQRKGLATAMYKHVEKVLGGPIHRGGEQSSDAMALWKQKNRPFGKKL